MNAPSTAWREAVAPDEEQRFAGYAKQFAALQAWRYAPIPEPREHRVSFAFATE